VAEKITKAIECLLRTEMLRKRAAQNEIADCHMKHSHKKEREKTAQYLNFDSVVFDSSSSYSENRP
jgi:hypothetical protein